MEKCWWTVLKNGIWNPLSSWSSINQCNPQDNGTVISHYIIHCMDVTTWLRMIESKDLLTLTVNPLKCFKDYKSSIHILYFILDFSQQNEIKFTMLQPYLLHILYCQYHSCWCFGDFRSQGINRHGIDGISQNILTLASEELTQNSYSSM